MSNITPSPYQAEVDRTVEYAMQAIRAAELELAQQEYRAPNERKTFHDLLRAHLQDRMAHAVAILMLELDFKIRQKKEG